MSEWDFEIEFPETEFEVLKTDRTHPDYPESHVTNWIMEGFKDSSYFMYFVASDILGEAQRKDAVLFEDGYYELLESVLAGGLRNYRSENITYQKNECDTLFSVTARADYLGTHGEGDIILKGYTNGYQLLILGVVSETKNVIDQKNFFHSLKLKPNSSVKTD